MPEIKTNEISNLECQIDQLIHYIKQLKIDNIALRNQLSQSARERSLLIHKNRKATQKIKKIITQLKEGMV